MQQEKGKKIKENTFCKSKTAVIKICSFKRSFVKRKSKRHRDLEMNKGEKKAIFNAVANWNQKEQEQRYQSPEAARVAGRDHPKGK